MQQYSRSDEIQVITCCVKKKEQKVINTKVIKKHNANAISRDQHSWRCSVSLIQTCLKMF